MADSGDTMDKLFGRAVAAQANGDLSVARQLYEALLAHGTHGDASTNLSICLFLLGDPARAEGHARDALATDPDNGNAHNNLGLALKVQGRVEDAVAAFDASARTHPQPAVPLTNLAVLFQALGRQAEALSAVDRALASDPFYPQAVELGITLRMEFVRWQDLDRLIASAKALVQKGIPFNPYALFTCCLDPAELLRAQAAYARQAMMDARAAAPWQAPPRRRAGARLKIGYVSSFFHAHAAAYLCAEVLEAQARSDMELFAYCYSPDRDQAFRDRILAHFDHIRDIRDLATGEAVEVIRADELDVLVDLNGYSNGGRMGILAARCAPVQMHWFGYPGGLGAPFIDYIIGDRYTTPVQASDAYREHIIRMPYSYFPSAASRVVDDQFGSRSALGLPEEALVLAVFNQTRKLTPISFEMWAGILSKVPKAVLWFWLNQPEAREPILRELAARGIAPERVFFSPSMELPLHLARFRYADLFLDSFPYNGHTLSNDALFMGCPVITLSGQTFPSRVAGSMLTALGLEGLIATTPQETVSKAVSVLQNPDTLAGLRRALAEPARRARLFGGSTYARWLETGFRQAVDRYRAGDPPRSFDVPLD